MAENNGVYIGGLWESTTKDGRWYLKGGFGTADIFIFPNDRKQSDNHPDYQMKIVPKKPREGGRGDGEGQQQRRGGPPRQQGGGQRGGGPPQASTRRQDDDEGQYGGVGDDDTPF
jgi:hypothetical protein